MPEVKRLNYFTSQFLVEQDFQDEQAYHRQMRYRHNRLLHEWGIAEGLEVTRSGDRQVSVSPGVAIDRQGQEIVLAEAASPEPSNLAELGANVNVYITITYRDFNDDADRYQAAGVDNFTRITERPRIAAGTAVPPTDGSVVTLAMVRLENGLISTIDPTVRQQVSAKLAPSTITSSQLADNAVTTAKITDGAVTRAKIDNGAISTAQIANNAVTSPQMADNAIITSKLADNAVSTSKLADNAVSTSKIQNGSINTAKLADSSVNITKMDRDIPLGTPGAIRRYQVPLNATVEGGFGANPFSIAISSEGLTLTTTASTPVGAYFASLNLPHGARLNHLIVSTRFSSSESLNLFIGLYRVPENSNFLFGDNQLAGITFNPQTGGATFTNRTVSITPHTVDNTANHRYLVRVRSDRMSGSVTIRTLSIEYQLISLF